MRKISRTGSTIAVSDELLWLTIDYGQRHAIEVARARQVATAMQAIKHTVLSVDLRALGGSALTGVLPVPKDRHSSERSRGIPARKRCWRPSAWPGKEDWTS